MGMLEADLYIVAAGTGSRLGGTVPKALIPIVSEPCLTTTLSGVWNVFRNIFVITNVLCRDVWAEYFVGLAATRPELRERVINLPIRSGLGDGHAVLEGLMAAERIGGLTLAPEMVVMWGDVFLREPELIRELLSRPTFGSGLIPAIFERDPYVCLRVAGEQQCISADFSKHGEHHSSGLHDQSVFRFRRAALQESLLELHRGLWKHDRYIAAGGELSLLYAFHQMYNADKPAYVYETKYSTRSFNTWEDVLRIQAEIEQQEALSSMPANCNGMDVDIRGKVDGVELESNAD